MIATLLPPLDQLNKSSEDLRRISGCFDGGNQSIRRCFIRVIGNREFIAVEKHFNFTNSVKLFQSLFDRLRSSHSYRAALTLAESVYVQTHSVSFLGLDLCRLSQSATEHENEEQHGRYTSIYQNNGFFRMH